MSDTPRTDAEVMYADCADSCLEVYVTRRADGKSHDGDIVSGDFARTLERELSAARAELEASRKETLERAQRCGRYVNTIVEHAATINGLRAELATARAEMRRHLPILEYVESLPPIWSDATSGTGIATLNGYRKAAGMDATAGEVKA